MLTHRFNGSRIRPAQPRELPPGTRFTVRDRVPFETSEPGLDDTAPRRTLAQELFASNPDQRPAASSELRPEAAAARRLDLNLIARLYSEAERRGERL
jgi:hypothetical protein